MNLGPVAYFQRIPPGPCGCLQLAYRGGGEGQGVKHGAARTAVKQCSLAGYLHLGGRLGGGDTQSHKTVVEVMSTTVAQELRIVTKSLLARI